MKLICTKPNGSVKEIYLLPNKDGSGWQFVDITDGHIAPCKFGSDEAALHDFQTNYMNKYSEVKFELKQSKPILGPRHPLNTAGE